MLYSMLAFFDDGINIFCVYPNIYIYIDCLH